MQDLWIDMISRSVQPRMGGENSALHSILEPAPHTRGICFDFIFTSYAPAPHTRGIYNLQALHLFGIRINPAGAGNIFDIYKKTSIFSGNPRRGGEYVL